MSDHVELTLWTVKEGELKWKFPAAIAEYKVTHSTRYIYHIKEKNCTLSPVVIFVNSGQRKLFPSTRTETDHTFTTHSFLLQLTDGAPSSHELGFPCAAYVEGPHAVLDALQTGMRVRARLTADGKRIEDLSIVN